MFGSLIGIFLTSAGILVGADSVLWGSSAPDSTRIEKTCRPGPQSVAVFEGWYGDQLYLHRRFLEACQTLGRSTKSRSLEVQADELIRKLQRTYQDHAGALPAKAASLPPPGSKHVVSVAVAGFEEGIPVVTVRELRWDKSRKGAWRLIAERIGRHSFQECGARFLGEDLIATILLDTSPHFALEKRRSEVLAGIRVNHLRKEDNCISSRYTIEEAKALYKTAVRITIDHAEEFFIQNGSVGGRLHLLTIQPDGSIEEELVDPEQYLQ